jgi:transcriptional regulator GlxA family with amidase domain
LVKKVKNIVTTGENNRKQFSFTDIEHTNHIYSEYDKKFLQDCMTIVKDNMSKCNFTVESLADHLNIHRRTLLRKFKALTGKLPIDLIKHARMTHAANLIRSQKYRVNEVAFMVGYEDNNRFSQAFKQFHGQSPSTYNSKN